MGYRSIYIIIYRREMIELKKLSNTYSYHLRCKLLRCNELRNKTFFSFFDVQFTLHNVMHTLHDFYV